MPVRVAQRPPGGLLHGGVPPSAGPGPGPGRCGLGPPNAGPGGSPPLPGSLAALAGPGPGGPGGGGGPPGPPGGPPVNAPNPLQAMASAAASLTQLNNMANGPLPPMGGPQGPPSLPPPQPATTPTHPGPPTPHQPAHLNGASPSPHSMPHAMMGSPHPHMAPSGPSPHPHHPGAPPHMVGSPHHPGPPPHMGGPGGPMMGPGPGMQPQPGPGMCGPAGPAGPMGPHGPHPGQAPGGPPPGQPHMHNDPFYCSPFGSPYFRSSMPVPRRHTPYYGQPDYRFYELNKRLSQRNEESDNLWWDSFATEFFEDDATLTLTFCLEDGPKRYTIGRTLIPRYFRSIFEGGVTELYYNLKHPKESFHQSSITLDCEHCVMVTHHGKPTFTKVCTEGRLILEFTFDDLMRIKSWHMAVRQHRELVPRAIVSMSQDPSQLEQLTKNITRQGITNYTLNYLKLCSILEPMQELMSRHKAYALSPRDCLKTTLFQKWQRMVAPPESNIKSKTNFPQPPESQRPTNKRRKRKGSASGPGNNAPPAPSKKRSPGPNFSLTTQDVMVVGEPSLMGGEFGDEDERLITRLENTQYDGSNSLDPHSHDTAGGPPPHPHQFHSEPQPGNSWPPDRGPGPPTGGPGNQGVQGAPGGAGAGVQGSQDSTNQQQQDKKSPAVSQ